VEHWDNIQKRLGPNSAGRTMVDGPTEVVDLELTEDNRSLVRTFIEVVLVSQQLDRIAEFIDEENFAEHNPELADGACSLRAALEVEDKTGKRVDYHCAHRVLAEGNFVLAASEGNLNGDHSAFYDLFRIANGKIVEHWDTTEKIAPRSEWKNNNGKF
jgi:predicted SnoaL-like aldol condensation-catalyzing enzyme